MHCPNCAADVDPLREYCPRCGAPTHSRLSGRRFGPPEPGGRPPDELKRNRNIVLAVGAGLLLLTAAAGKFHPFGFLSLPRHVHIDTDNAPRGPVTIGAAELFEAYHRDSDAADKRFGDREMVVTGEFVRTVPDGYGSIDMRLKTAHPDLPLGIDLDGHSVDAATKLKPGEIVTVSCRDVAGTGDDPWLQECALQPPAAGAPAAPTAPAAETPPAPPAAPSSRS